MIHELSVAFGSFCRTFHAWLSHWKWMGPFHQRAFLRHSAASLPQRKSKLKPCSPSSLALGLILLTRFGKVAPSSCCTGKLGRSCRRVMERPRILFAEKKTESLTEHFHEKKLILLFAWADSILVKGCLCLQGQRKTHSTLYLRAFTWVSAICNSSD